MNKFACVLIAIAFFGGVLAAPADSQIDCNKPPQSVSRTILFIMI